MQRGQPQPSPHLHPSYRASLPGIPCRAQLILFFAFCRFKLSTQFQFFACLPAKVFAAICVTRRRRNKERERGRLRTATGFGCLFSWPCPWHRRVSSHCRSRCWCRLSAVRRLCQFTITCCRTQPGPQHSSAIDSLRIDIDFDFIFDFHFDFEYEKLSAAVGIGRLSRKWSAPSFNAIPI